MLPYYHMGKADFLYFEVEAAKGINLIMFRNSSLTFSAKIRKKKLGAFFNNKPFMLHSTSYSALNPFPIEMHTKHVFSKNANKKCTLIFFHIFEKNFHWLFE